MTNYIKKNKNWYVSQSHATTAAVSMGCGLAGLCNLLTCRCPKQVKNITPKARERILHSATPGHIGGPHVVESAQPGRSIHQFMLHY